MAVYTLPELPYDYAALEPHISGKIMELHHDKHHAAYVGHTNPSIFWKNLSPNGGGQPEGELAEAIKDSFGSFEKFQAQFTATAMGIQGSGWAVLAYDSLSGKLVTFQLFDQQGNVPVGTIPLFMVDMWEHAFYLDYLNVKADYVKAIWNIANWQNVAERLEAAKKGTLVI